MITFLSVVSGAIGGNFTAGLFRGLNLGLWLNVIFGGFGGALAGCMLANFGPESRDLASLMIATFGAAFAGGGLVCVLGLLRKFLRIRKS